MTTIYVIATPIGNLQDITLRSLEILKTVDLILCEDTRMAKKLLSHFEIQKPTISFHKFSEQNKYQKIFELLKQGKNLALISDAGTPAISDPGAFLIKEIREKMPEIAIVPIPGASALTATLSVAGLIDSQFIFMGFPPHKKGRRIFFEKIQDITIPVVLYESKHRLIKTLQTISEKMPERQVFLAKEITKLNENFFEGSAEKIMAILKTDQNLLKGEFVIILK
jgi:16S rRNA (cytidine1402-2'-O)-methyltransferase